MKKILLLLVISIGIISLVYYELENDKITTAKAEAEKAAILDAELAAFEAELMMKLTLQAKEVEIAWQASNEASLDAFQKKLADDKTAAAASTAAYRDSLLAAEFTAFETQLEAELAAQEMMAEIEVEMARQVSLEAFQEKLAVDKAAAARSTAAYQSKRVNDARISALMSELSLEQELAAFETQLEAELAAQEMMAEIEVEMARQVSLEAFQEKLAVDKAAAAASTAAYQSKLARDERLKNKRAELKLENELTAFEAQLEAELAAQEMMAEIEVEMARQVSLEAFQEKLAADKATAAASTAAYQARLVSEAIEREIDEFEAKLMEDLLEESTGVEIIITGETHNLCKATLGLSENNIQLFKKALSGKYLYSTGPQGKNGTEFSSSRWDNYISCISSLNNEL